MNPNCPPEIHPFTSRWFDYNQPILTSEEREAWVMDKEKGYFGFLSSRQIKHLIIGSFPIWASVHHDPPHAGFEFAFFYCSRVNGFFRFLETLSGYDFFPAPLKTTPHQKAQSITQFFLKKQLGITDILSTIKRTDAGCHNADDKSIHVNDFNHLLNLLKVYRSINHIYFTSANVHEWFKESLKQVTGNGQMKQTFLYSTLGRLIHLHNLCSPSKMANTAVAGNLNKDDVRYEQGNRLRDYMSGIPFVVNLLDEKDQYRVCQWAKYLSNSPGLVRSEILEHPNFIAIKGRL